MSSRFKVRAVGVIAEGSGLGVLQDLQDLQDLQGQVVDAERCSLVFPPAHLQRAESFPDTLSLLLYCQNRKPWRTCQREGVTFDL